MAFFSDVVFDEQTSRHERFFVNQRNDFLFVISWKPALSDDALADARREISERDAVKR